jgi:hypothetical protein
VKLDEAILEEIKRAGPGSRPELIRRMAGRMTPALDRLTDGGLLYKVGNRPDRPVSSVLACSALDLLSPVVFPQKGRGGFFLDAAGTPWGTK